MGITIQQLGLLDYQACWQDMQAFTQQRSQNTQDEIRIVEHPAVYTLGLAGKKEHIHSPNDIPVIQTDRGGQVTYHGPGQLIIYVLIDIARLHLGVRKLVTILERAMIDSLSHYGIKAIAKADAPGVYVAGKKIGSVGLRIKKGCSYHGLSLNNNMDMSPFHNINPCGHQGLEMTQLIDLGVKISSAELAIPVIHSIYRAIAK
jgi:lipoyl(octanoyl) transferase